MVSFVGALWLMLPSYVLAGHHPVQYPQKIIRPSSSLDNEYPAHQITIPFDHFHNETRYEPHTSKTFQNSYWLDTSNYVEGGPVIVHAMGEDGTFDLPFLQKGLLQELANATRGVAVLWGQRFYAGNYYPPGVGPDRVFNTSNLRFMSTEQALADLAYFSRYVTFPGLEHKNLTAPGTPWIIIGGSYAGVISAFTRIQYPNLFWGGLTSSGVTTGIIDFWQAYDVVRRYGPHDCIEAWQKFTNVADNIFLSGNKSAITQFKTAFGAENLTNHDLANLLASPMGSFQHTWVPGKAYSFNGSGTFCANVTSQKSLFPNQPTASARDILNNGGWANETDKLLHPLLNWISSIKTTYTRFCPKGKSLDICFGTRPGLPGPFNWLGCTENPLFFTGYTPGSKGRPHVLPIASRLLTSEYSLQTCRETYNFSKSWQPDLSYYERFGGFNLSYPRLAISTGQIDVWRPSTPLAEYVALNVPNRRIKSTGNTSEPQIIIQGASHEWDLSGSFPNETNATVPPAVVKLAHQREIDVVKAWLEEWNSEHPSS